MFQSSAPLGHLKQRAQVLQRIRAYFERQGVWEADVPCLGHTGVTDIHLEPLTTQVLGRTAYLQTSPEFYLKRLLAMGSGDLYYLGKAFRQGDYGSRHRPEFTLLEWYRLGLNAQQLAQEVVALITHLAPATQVQVLSYKQLFLNAFNLNPHTASLATLQTLAQQRFNVAFKDEAIATWLDLLFTHGIEPAMPQGLLVVTDYPACQSALARLGQNAEGDTIAERFEVYWDGLELANGYWELTCPKEQAARFKADLTTRQTTGKPLPPVDVKLLAALEAGLPDCAGVALGVDRLLMKLLGVGDIAQVVGFGEG